MAPPPPVLTYAEAEALRGSNYPCPPGYRCPPGWTLSVGGVPVAPVAEGAARRSAITHHYYAELTPEQRMHTGWHPDNNRTWDAFFINRRERELARHVGDGPPPVNNDEEGRRLWWSGRTLASVMEYITAGDYPRLRYPRGHHVEPPLPPVDRTQAWWKVEQHYRARAAEFGQGSSRSHPRARDDDIDDSDDYDDFSDDVYRPRQEYD